MSTRAAAPHPGPLPAGGERGKRAFVEIDPVTHAYGGEGGAPAVERLTLAIEEGEFAAVVDKIIAYESFESPEWMNGNVMLCSVEQNLVEALESTAKIVTDYNSGARFERVYADPKLEDTIYAPKAVAFARAAGSRFMARRIAPTLARGGTGDPGAIRSCAGSL